MVKWEVLNFCVVTTQISYYWATSNISNPKGPTKTGKYKSHLAYSRCVTMRGPTDFHSLYLSHFPAEKGFNCYATSLISLVGHLVESDLYFLYISEILLAEALTNWKNTFQLDVTSIKLYWYMNEYSQGHQSDSFRINWIHSSAQDFQRVLASCSVLYLKWFQSAFTDVPVAWL